MLSNELLSCIASIGLPLFSVFEYVVADIETDKVKMLNFINLADCNIEALFMTISLCCYDSYKN